VGVGCHHTAGVCDCCNNCGGLDGPGAAPVAVAPAGPIMPHAVVSYPSGNYVPTTLSDTGTVRVHMPAPIIQEAH